MELFGGYVPFVVAPARFDVGGETYFALTDAKSMIHCPTNVELDQNSPPSPADFVLFFWKSVFNLQLDEVGLSASYWSEHRTFTINNTEHGKLKKWRVEGDDIRSTAIGCHFFIPSEEEGLSRNFFEGQTKLKGVHFIRVSEIIQSEDRLAQKVDRFVQLLGLQGVVDEEYREIVAQLFEPPPVPELMDDRTDGWRGVLPPAGLLGGVLAAFWYFSTPN